MVWPNPAEVATLTVNKQKFSDWETVMVKHTLRGNPPFWFRFTCSEPLPFAKNWEVMRIRPGDKCTISLGGILAFTGLVSTRQVYYDARRHYVEIQGSDYNSVLNVTSTVTKNQEYKKINIEQFIRAQIKPYGLKLKVEGGQLPQHLFDRISLPHGMSTYQTIDMHLRSLGSFPITSNVQSDFVVIAGPSGTTDTVEEGKNILVGREIIFNSGAGASGSIPSLHQRPGTDDLWGAAATHIPFFQQAYQDAMGSESFGGPIVAVGEIPGWSKNHWEGRSNAERNWQQEDEVTVYATVRGWFKPSGGLWSRAQKMVVKSPMLIMDGSVPLILKSVTFSQDNNEGTRSVLEMMNEKALAKGAPSLKE